ncbi:MAG: hypothetical protein U9R17_06800, partial [Thermodesulfobacteriota bacterium]|nr:hypothetical protein [Thermodesulfobacteriota bacterium]
SRTVYLLWYCHKRITFKFYCAEYLMLSAPHEMMHIICGHSKRDSPVLTAFNPLIRPISFFH